MKNRTFIIIAWCVVFGAAGCRNGRPVHLKIEGLSAALESGTVRSLAVEGDGLVLKGAGPSGEFLIRVSPWTAGAPLAPGQTFELSVRTAFIPDGPATVLQLSDQAGSPKLVIGYRARENTLLLPGYRLHPGKKTGDAADSGRLWTDVLLEKPDGTRTAVALGTDYRLEAVGRVWTLVVPGASLRSPRASGAEIAAQDPAFIADYILYSEQ